MPCEHYKDALIETAASGAMPQGELRAHLAECASCRKAVAEEQSLFASIDSSLHAAANAEVPPYVLPGIRIALEQAVPDKRSWLSEAFALASAVAVVMVLFTVRVARRSGDGDEQMKTEASAKAMALAPQAMSQKDPGSSEPPRISSTHAAVARSSTLPRSKANPTASLEVLVPGDQEALLANYAEQWHLHKGAPLVASETGGASLDPLQVAPIQITQLDVMLLAEGDSR